MPHHEEKNCPRCNADFECKVGAVLECQCSDVFLTTAERDYVNSRYDDCLCVSCLVEMQAEFSILCYKKNLSQYLRH